jgi:hypothetical protein
MDREGPPVPGFRLREFPRLMAGNRQRDQGLRAGRVGLENLAVETIGRRQIPGLVTLPGEIQELGGRRHGAANFSDENPRSRGTLFPGFACVVQELLSIQGTRLLACGLPTPVARS